MNEPLKFEIAEQRLNFTDSKSRQRLQHRSGGRAPRQKGGRFERAIVRLFQDAGLGAERVPLSGSAGGSYRGDLTCPLLGRDLVVEAKSRARGFAQLYKWLEGRDALILRADRKDALCVLPLRLAVEIAAAGRGKHLTGNQKFTRQPPHENGCPGYRRDSRSHGRLAKKLTNGT